MSRPPIKAITAIKNYCEKTQCRRCIFGFEERALHNYVGCRLLETPPCDWDIDKDDKDIPFISQICPICGNNMWGYENGKIVCAVCGNKIADMRQEADNE